MRKRLLILPLLFFIFISTAQEPYRYDHPFTTYLEANNFFDENIYGYARHLYDRVESLTLAPDLFDWEKLQNNSELKEALAALNMDAGDGALLMDNYIADHRHDPIATRALIAMGDHYYRQRKYQPAIDYYSDINRSSVDDLTLSEINFKEGYCYFALKDFDQARANFTPILDIPTKYYYPTHYYYGMASYYKGSYEEALESFSKIEDSRKYRDYLPYYIIQIRFANGGHEEVIRYGEEVLTDESVKNKEEIHKLVGQAYFENENFQKAGEHLKIYADAKEQLTPEEWFLLGYSEYKTGNYAESIDHLKFASRLDSPLGQQASLYLADASIKTGDLASGRNAYLRASEMDYNPDAKIEALFNYGKLSAQLNYDREAVKALEQITPNSTFYVQAQNALGRTLSETKDYKKAIEIIEGMQEKTPEIKAAYQKVTYNRAVQFIQSSDHAKALEYLEKSLSVPVNNRIKAMALFQKGRVLFNQKKYEESAEVYNSYLTLTKNMADIAVMTGIPLARYNLGYNYLRMNRYELSSVQFEEAVRGMRMNPSYNANQFIQEKILPDAIIRAADSYFKRNNYTKALSYYNEIIESYPAINDYALFQKGIIKGLQKDPYDKIILLEQIVEERPESPYVDDALLEIADTYHALGQTDKAFNALRDLIEKAGSNSPLVIDALLKMGLISYNQGDYDSALEYYTRIFDHNPSAEDARSAISAVEEIYLRDRNEPDRYFAFLERYRLGSTDELARDSISFKSAEYIYINGDYKRAITAFDNYIQSYPRGLYVEEAFFLKGESALLLEQYDKAYNSYEKVIERGKSPYYQRAVKNAALIAYNYKKDWENSLRYYNLWHQSSDNPEEKLEAALGVMYASEKLGDARNILESVDEIITSEHARFDQKITAHYLGGKSAFRLNLYSQALNHFNEVIRNSDHEKAAEARYYVTRIYYEEDELDLAQQMAENGIRESAGYPYWVAKQLLLLSDILIDKEDFFNARAASEAIIENYDEDADLIREAREKIEIIDAMENTVNPVNEKGTDRRQEILEMEEPE